MLISSTLKNWYLQNKRELPWRITKNPYHIWVSEIILQQTRVNQGIPYYFNFIEKYPDIESLASANIEDVYKIWQGLGYYSRAKNLHEGAKFVRQNFNGYLPDSYSELIKIKGIGEYTASAIASFAFNQPHPAIDGNVNRVIARLFGVTEPVNTASGKKNINQIAEKILDLKKPGEFNQAIMEFGALQCIPKNPDCYVCPLKNYCYALKHEMVSLLPIKKKSNKFKIRHFYYFVILLDKEYIFLRKRNKKDIWHGLYEFPLIETDKNSSVKDLVITDEWEKLYADTQPNINSLKKHFKHQLSHQTIEATFIQVEINKISNELKNNYIKIKRQDLSNFPVSRLIEKFLQSTDI